MTSDCTSTENVPSRARDTGNAIVLLDLVLVDGNNRQLAGLLVPFCRRTSL